MMNILTPGGAIAKKYLPSDTDFLMGWSCHQSYEGKNYHALALTEPLKKLLKPSFQQPEKFRWMSGPETPLKPHANSYYFQSMTALQLFWNWTQEDIL